MVLSHMLLFLIPDATLNNGRGNWKPRMTMGALSRFARACGAALIMALSILLLTRCSSLSTLPDGHKSSMLPENVTARFGMAISAPGSPVTLSYHTVPRCTYTQTTELLTASKATYNVTVTTRSIADKIQVVLVRNSDDPETALIGHNGHIFDFNTKNRALQGRRNTTETEQAQARELISENQVGKTRGSKPTRAQRVFLCPTGISRRAYARR